MGCLLTLEEVLPGYVYFLPKTYRTSEEYLGHLSIMMRGLEHFAQQGRWKRHARQCAYWNAVLEEQGRQWKSGTASNPDRIAALGRQESRAAVWEARQDCATG